MSDVIKDTDLPTVKEAKKRYQAALDSLFRFKAQRLPTHAQSDFYEIVSKALFAAQIWCVTNYIHSLEE